MRQDIEDFFNSTGAHIENEDYGGVYIGATDKVYFKYPADCKTEDEYYENCFKCIAFWAENKLAIVNDVDAIADATADLLCDQFKVNKSKAAKPDDRAKIVVSYLNRFQGAI